VWRRWHDYIPEISSVNVDSSSALTRRTLSLAAANSSMQTEHIARLVVLYALSPSDNRIPLLEAIISITSGREYDGKI